MSIQQPESCHSLSDRYDPFADRWVSLSPQTLAGDGCAGGCGGRLYAVEGRLGKELTAVHRSYQAIYTILVPIIR